MGSIRKLEVILSSHLNTPQLEETASNIFD